MIDLDIICETITRETGKKPVGAPRKIAGGCINEAFRLGEYFIKSNTSAGAGMFEMELVGLTTLHDTATVKVPRPICSGIARDRSFLVLELLSLEESNSAAQELLGRQLADLHRTTSTHFGWHSDNYIGTTTQPNTLSSSWVDFLRESRLGHMLRLAGNLGFSFRGADALLDNLDCFFEEPPSPSLLHGDLWGGNAGALTNGVPVIFDPAVYYGDREADLAMTQLFGGFNSSFYQAYQEAWPLPRGHERRMALYNLYHVLNHSILFGGSYARQAQSMIDSLLQSL